MVHVTEFTSDLIHHHKLRLDPSRNDHWRGIRRLHERGVRLTLKTAILTWNEHEVDAMRSLAKKLRVTFRSDGMLNARVDCGANRNGELQVPPERLVRIERREERRRRALDELIASAVDAHGAAPGPAASEVFGCGAGLTGFTVDPYGQLHLCATARRNPFDLRTVPFLEGWNRHLPLVRAHEWRENDVCPTCSLLPACTNCAGAAELEHGNPEGLVAAFCELTHRRAFASLGQARGHEPDASCCLDRMAPTVTGRARLERRPASAPSRSLTLRAFEIV